MKVMFNSKRGFTLIELLIVVAIIAILAAIAVPNFLEAQVRSKVARVQADMRSIATALEAYRVDHNKYPPSNAPPGEPIESWFDRLIPLTTPVSFLTSVMLDPFSIQLPGANAGNQISYGYDNGETRYGGLLPSFYWINGGGRNPHIWVLTSNGPDKSATWHDPYDATNGTVSYGEIFRFGP